MADGSYASQYLPAFSHLMGELEQPTNAQSMMNPQFGGSPQQLMGILQHPQTQALLGQLGIHFDPGSIKQSPFLPQPFMQHHPRLGGALTNAMANVAATPEAPLVSGAGSGMSRAMQGMQGGPEMLRQYQVRQMLAPFQAMGSTIPGQEFQRKQHLLDLLTQMEQDRAAQSRAGMTEKAREFDLTEQRRREDEGVMRGGPKFNQQTGETYLPHPAIPAAPQGQPQRQEQTQAGPGLPGIEGTEGLVSPMAPGTPARPYQPAGYDAKPADPNAIKNVHPERQALADMREALVNAGLPEAQVDLAIARATEAREKGAAAAAKPGGHDKGYWDKRYGDMDEKISNQIRALESAIANPQANEEQKTLWKQQIDQLNQQREQEKARIDADRGQPGASVPYRAEPRYTPKGGKTSPPQVNPNAQPAPTPAPQAAPKSAYDF